MDSNHDLIPQFSEITEITSGKTRIDYLRGQSIIIEENYLNIPKE